MAKSTNNNSKNAAMIAALRRERDGLRGREDQERRVGEIDEQLKRYGYVKGRTQPPKSDATA